MILELIRILAPHHIPYPTCQFCREQEMWWEGHKHLKQHKQFIVIEICVIVCYIQTQRARGVSIWIMESGNTVRNQSNNHAHWTFFLIIYWLEWIQLVAEYRVMRFSLSLQYDFQPSTNSEWGSLCLVCSYCPVVGILNTSLISWQSDISSYDGSLR